jgi:hypothetical protein
VLTRGRALAMPVAVPGAIGESEERGAEPKMDPSKPAALQFRPLQADDYDRGYLECLSHLTTVGDISREQFNGIAAARPSFQA